MAGRESQVQSFTHDPAARCRDSPIEARKRGISMGRLIVSEAPAGRRSSRLDLASGSVGHDGPPRLALVQAGARELTFVGRYRARAPLLLCPLLLLLASLPWLSPEAMTGLRWLTCASCLAAAAALAWRSWPHTYKLQVRRDGDGDAEGPGHQAPGQILWILDAEPEPDSPRGAYTVRLETDGAERWTVLRNESPGVVLRSLRAILVHWPAPVECRWGLPASARPWSFEPGPLGARLAGETPTKAVLRAPLCGRGLLWTLSVMTLVMLAELAFLVLSESAKLPRVHVLSVFLPILTAGGLVAITLILATAHVRLSVTARLLAELSVIGVRRRRGDVDVASVRGVYAIGAGGSDRWHVLIDSREGPLAVPVERSHAEVMVRETRLAIAETQLSRG